MRKRAALFKARFFIIFIYFKYFHNSDTDSPLHFTALTERQPSRRRRTRSANAKALREAACRTFGHFLKITCHQSRAVNYCPLLTDPRIRTANYYAALLAAPTNNQRLSIINYRVVNLDITPLKAHSAYPKRPHRAENKRRRIRSYRKRKR